MPRSLSSREPLKFPNLIINRTREAGLSLPPLRFQGWFTVQLIDAKSGLIKRHLEFPNVLTNVLFDRWGNRSGNLSSNFPYLEVGTGSTAPTAADTSLVSAVTPRTNASGGDADVIGYDSGDSFHYIRTTRLFTEAQANGNLTELGFWTALSSGSMSNRQLFKDSGGTPTTLVKTSADQLKVIYEIRCYPPLTDTDDSITLDSISYDYTIRSLNSSTSSVWGFSASGFNPRIGARIGESGGPGAWGAYEVNTLQATTATSISGTESGSSSQALSSYTGGTYFLDQTIKWEPGVGNFGTGIGTILAVHPWGSMSGGASNKNFQIVFHTTKIPKLNTQRLTLVFRWSWASVSV